MYIILDADKDECTEDPSPCDDNAVCVNKINGTYTCSCEEGFLGNGHECQRIGKSVSLSHYGHSMSDGH